MAAAPVANHVHLARVVRVIDGDTFVARVELDFRVKVDITVRVRDLNAPEMRDADGVEAKLDLENRIAANDHVVTLLSYKDRMSFARWVCDVWIGDAHLAQNLNGVITRHL